MAKYCINCGKQISDNADFCKYCGQNQNEKIRSTRNAAGAGRTTSRTAGRSARQKRKINKNIIIIPLIALLLVGLAAAAVIAVKHFGIIDAIRGRSNKEAVVSEKIDQDSNKDQDKDKKEESAQEETRGAKTEESKVKENKEDQKEEEKKEAKTEEETKKDAEDSAYKVGESYTVQTNLRVRAGPGKDYRILERSELKEEDFVNSVDSKETKDALMEKGSKVTCLEMDGKWMRITSGWVCVEDEGEILVK